MERVFIGRIILNYPAPRRPGLRMRMQALAVETINSEIDILPSVIIGAVSSSPLPIIYDCWILGDRNIRIKVTSVLNV